VDGHPPRAQQKAMPVIGFPGSTSPLASAIAALRQGLSETGYLQASIRIVNVL
jgi:hypothetical protein